MNTRLLFVSFRSFLSGYVLTIEVMTVERGLKSWKSVRGCSVQSLESDTQPEWLAETIMMTQVSDANKHNCLLLPLTVLRMTAERTPVWAWTSECR